MIVMNNLFYFGAGAVCIRVYFNDNLIAPLPRNPQSRRSCIIILSQICSYKIIFSPLFAVRAPFLFRPPPPSFAGNSLESLSFSLSNSTFVCPRFLIKMYIEGWQNLHFIISKQIGTSSRFRVCYFPLLLHCTVYFFFSHFACEKCGRKKEKKRKEKEKSWKNQYLFWLRFFCQLDSDVGVVIVIQLMENHVSVFT